MRKQQKYLPFLLFVEICFDLLLSTLHFWINKAHGWVFIRINQSKHLNQWKCSFEASHDISSEPIIQNYFLNPLSILCA